MTPIEMGKELINLSATPYFRPQIREGGIMLIQLQNKIELLEAENAFLKLKVKAQEK